MNSFNYATVQKYLTLYTNPKPLANFNHSLLGEHKFDHVAIIPCFAEPTNFFFQLRQNLTISHKILWIIIVNCPEQCSSEDRQLTQVNLSTLRDIGKPLSTQHQYGFLQLNLSEGLLLIDATHPGLPKQQGVGLARKIGSDIACRLITTGYINFPWMHQLDADVILPCDYFSIIHQLNIKATTAALIYPFSHQTAQQQLQLCASLYEVYLYYYQAGLNWAKSPYAFTTIGSTIACHFYYYALVRGFPKRSAGEDFYLLNKLIKVGSILQLKQPCITISGRCSFRVPFGTGPKVWAYSELLDKGLLPTLQPPQSFFWLKILNQCIYGLFKKKSSLQQLPPLLQAVLNQLNCDKFFSHQQNYKSFEQKIFQWNLWFDALRTLKFIHYFQDQYQPYPFFKALYSAEFIQQHWIRPPKFTNVQQQIEFIQKLSTNIKNNYCDSRPNIHSLSVDSSGIN